jgi:hypothetical protein
VTLLHTDFELHPNYNYGKRRGSEEGFKQEGEGGTSVLQGGKIW